MTRVSGVTLAVSPSREHRVVGVVDPFLKADAQVSDLVWIFMDPAQVLTTRHQWSHPDIPDHDAPSPIRDDEVAELWMRRFAENNGLTFPQALALPDNAALYSAVFEGERGGEESLRYWRNWKALTGQDAREPGATPS